MKSKRKMQKNVSKTLTQNSTFSHINQKKYLHMIFLLLLHLVFSSFFSSLFWSSTFFKGIHSQKTRHISFHAHTHIHHILLRHNYIHFDIYKVYHFVQKLYAISNRTCCEYEAFIVCHTVQYLRSIFLFTFFVRFCFRKHKKNY